MTSKDLEPHYRRSAPLFRRNRQVSELTTQNRFNVGDYFLCRNVFKGSSFWQCITHGDICRTRWERMRLIDGPMCWKSRYLECSNRAKTTPNAYVFLSLPSALVKYLSTNTQRKLQLHHLFKTTVIFTKLGARVDSEVQIQDGANSS